MTLKNGNFEFCKLRTGNFKQFAFEEWIKEKIWLLVMSIVGNRKLLFKKLKSFQHKLYFKFEKISKNLSFSLVKIVTIYQN